VVVYIALNRVVTAVTHKTVLPRRPQSLEKNVFFTVFSFESYVLFQFDIAANVIAQETSDRQLKRDNPHKYLLYRPTFFQLYTFISTAVKVGFHVNNNFISETN